MRLIRLPAVGGVPAALGDVEAEVHHALRDVHPGRRDAVAEFHRVVHFVHEQPAIGILEQVECDDPAAARATAERIWDRTPGTEPAVQMANQMGMVFAKLDCKPRWRERLSELAIPALVVHGRRDPFFPVGNGEALAREIPGARLLVLEQAATAIPDAAAREVAAAMLQLQAL